MKEFKSLTSWYNELPEPIKSEAIENCKRNPDTIVADSLYSAILVGFMWTTSKQGYQYWNNISKKYN
jgi:hypothetical protein